MPSPPGTLALAQDFKWFPDLEWANVSVQREEGDNPRDHFLPGEDLLEFYLLLYSEDDAATAAGNWAFAMRRPRISSGMNIQCTRSWTRSSPHRSQRTAAAGGTADAVADPLVGPLCCCPCEMDGDSALCHAPVQRTGGRPACRGRSSKTGSISEPKNSKLLATH